MPKLYPAHLVERFRGASKQTFLDEFARVHFLAVTIPEDSPQLAMSLESTVAGLTEDISASAALGYMTRLPTSAERPPPPRLDSNLFLVPIRKRPEANRAFKDRVTVGRARNSDIVLRHPNLSKFHAWFERNDDWDLSITDAGSKNGTFHRGERLSPRMPVPLNVGDEVRFGDVHASIMSAEDAYSLIKDAP